MANKKRRKEVESLPELVSKGERLEALINLGNSLREAERRDLVHFNDFLYQTSGEPELALRDIFQYFHDMVHYFVPEGTDEYERTEESIGFMNFDFRRLFVQECDDPFFADRLFANRFMRLIREFNKGIKNNHIYLFEGPPGSGKSTFLNNLLLKLEAYNKSNDGVMFRSLWRIDIQKLGGISIPEIYDNEEVNGRNIPLAHKRYLEIMCPSGDHPILMIPKDFRLRFLKELIPSRSFIRKLQESKEYRWVLTDNPCSICNSIYNTLLDKLGDPLEVYKMLYARKSAFDRQFGIGISVFNPGDDHIKKPITDISLQNIVNNIFTTDKVKYVYSHLANTNNGVYALMDIKDNNVQRLVALHGIISDGIHKVDMVEEKIRSLFVGLVNPEDKKHYEGMKSFQDRIITINIPYILDYETEVSIYRNKFGCDIDKKFLPGVLENFAKIIISSRLEKHSDIIESWIKDKSRYAKYLDKDSLLLKMELYKGIIPDWLSEEDIRNFTKVVRKGLIMESEDEGRKGISGRQSLSIFNTFLDRNVSSDKLITMDMVKSYFITVDDYEVLVPENFIDALVDMYDYDVLQEVKESIYYFSEKQISRDIMNYIFAINFESGATERCYYTGDVIEINEDYFKNFEALFLGTVSKVEERHAFRKEVHNEYVTHTLPYEINVMKIDIKKTKQFLTLFEKYTKNLKENALSAFSENENFRRAINDYDTQGFNNYDEVIKRTVIRLINKLTTKFNYNTIGAKQVCLYVVDKKLDKKY